MKKQIVFTAAAMFLGAAAAAGGCGSSNGSVPGGGGGTSAGSGGTTGGGGATGFDPTTPIPTTGTIVETFDTSTDGFTVNNYVDTGNTTPGTGSANLGAADSGTAADVLLAWDSAVGSPTAGSMMITAPFTGSNQYVDVLKAVKPSADWTGKKLHVRVKVDSGFVTSMTGVLGIVQPYADTGTTYTFGTMMAFVPAGNAWHDYTIDLAALAGTTPSGATVPFDPTMIVQYGIQFQTGSGAATDTTAVFHVDSFWLE
jgi:hypothetical protein